MAIMSGGELVLADTSPTFARSTYWAPGGIGLTQRFASYAAIYRAQLWVYVVTNKLAYGTARLPFKIYERDEGDGRSEARSSAFARLMRRPNPKHDPAFFWLWTATTKEIYGEALWMKVRGRDGLPAELWPLHPVNVQTQEENGELFYYFYGNGSTEPKFAIPAADVVHFRMYNPDTTVRGMSPIEPLRQTLVNEDAARRATASFWQRGARPGVALTHPGTLSEPAAKRLKARWDELAAGADRTGSTVVLEEGMEPKILSLNQEEAQYIETRKLNREEVCATYDIPPPVVHILDHATYSNITEQMRSMYRDTMAPRLGLYESTIDQQLRSDFVSDDSLYGEFLLDEVLRGDFEVRADAKQKLIGSAQLTPNEGRAMENLPPVEGGDRLFINSTFIPIDDAVADEPAGDAEPPLGMDGAPKGFARWVAAKVTGRASRAATLEEVDPATLTSGLNGDSATVLALLDQSKAAGDDISTFCALVWALAGGARDHV